MKQAQMMFGFASDIIEEAGQKKYQDFVEKFDGPKTTDDCYTPPEIYEAVAAWVEKTYGYRRGDFEYVRPFRPGGDYQAETYNARDVVVDNPPFSILSKICAWYTERRILFFLFAPTLTILNTLKNPKLKEEVCVILCGAPIVYENGAEVNTSFITNLDREYNLRIEPDIFQKIDEISETLRRAAHKELPKYNYPDYVLTGKEYRLAKYGQRLLIPKGECVAVRGLDAQKEYGKNIFGCGLLLSERAAAERAAAERAAAERAAAKKWELSEREWEIVRKMRHS